jgi:hypothetical protein
MTPRLAVRDGTFCSTLTMQFRIQFLDGSAQVIGEMFAYARNAVGAIGLVADVDWPPAPNSDDRRDRKSLGRGLAVRCAQEAGVAGRFGERVNSTDCVEKLGN